MGQERNPLSHPRILHPLDITLDNGRSELLSLVLRHNGKGVYRDGRAVFLVANGSGGRSFGSRLPVGGVGHGVICYGGGGGAGSDYVGEKGGSGVNIVIG